MIEKGMLFLCKGLSERVTTTAVGNLPVFLKILPENETNTGGKQRRRHRVMKTVFKPLDQTVPKLIDACTLQLQDSFLLKPV